MANNKNLVNISDRATDVQREIRSKGGKARAEKMREMKSFKERFQVAMSMPLKDKDAKKYMTEMGFEKDDISNADAVVISMFREALNGNVRAYEAIRDTLGEKPTDKLSIEEAPVIKLERPHG